MTGSDRLSPVKTDGDRLKPIETGGDRLKTLKSAIADCMLYTRSTGSQTGAGFLWIVCLLNISLRPVKAAPVLSPFSSGPSAILVGR